MSKNKSRIQYLLNEYLETYGSIDLRLPDGVDVEIGITQEGKHGIEKKRDYCWITTKRDTRLATFDRYGFTMQFPDQTCHVVDQAPQGIITVI